MGWLSTSSSFAGLRCLSGRSGLDTATGVNYEF